MDHERAILPTIYISISQTLSVMIFCNDFFICSGLMVKINRQLREHSVLIVLPGEEKVVGRPYSTFQYRQVPTRKAERDSVSGAVVVEGVMGTNCKRGNLS